VVTTGFNIQKFYVLPRVYLLKCFMWISERTATVSRHSIKWLTFRRLRSITKSGCLFFRKERLGFQKKDFHKIWYLIIFRKYVFTFDLNLTRIMVLYMKTNIHIWSYLTEFFSKRGMLPTKVVEKIKTHTFIFNNFSPENRVVYEIM
jgi:hypothetical protein